MRPETNIEGELTDGRDDFLLDTWSRDYPRAWRSGPDVVEKAKAEGKLVWWGGGTEAEDREFIKRFNQKYPFVAVEQWNTSSKATQERVWAEFTAKKFSWDVITGGGRAAQDWVKAGMMQKWSVPGSLATARRS